MQSARAVGVQKIQLARHCGDHAAHHPAPGRKNADRAEQDWDEHSRILAAVIDGDEELASVLATRHVHRAAESAFAAAKADDAGDRVADDRPPPRGA